jgi:hypothetical protein
MPQLARVRPRIRRSRESHSESRGRSGSNQEHSTLCNESALRKLRAAAGQSPRAGAAHISREGSVCRQQSAVVGPVSLHRATPLVLRRQSEQTAASQLGVAHAHAQSSIG